MIKPLGFVIEESMIGTHEFESGCSPAHSEDGKTYPFEFHVAWGSLLKEWANPFGKKYLRSNINGCVRIGGMGAFPCIGKLDLNYLSKANIRYEFIFMANGEEYRYVGEKVNIKPWNILTSHTTCFGTITKTSSGKLISRSVTHFKAKTIISFLKSLRISRCLVGG